jgi:hypothetical protein
MTARTEILVYAFGAVGRILIMTADTDHHIESFRDIAFAVSGYFSKGSSLGNPPDHDFCMADATGIANIIFMY